MQKIELNEKVDYLHFDANNARKQLVYKSCLTYIIIMMTYKCSFSAKD